MISKLIHSTWALEFWALAGCLGSFAALVLVLAVFNGRNVFEWNGVTLNTVVSILSVSLKACLVFGLGECIGQWKWIVFSRSKRELMDFERIDLASRGPMGSFQLIWLRQTPQVLRLGVIIMVLTIALDPFSQQLVHLEPAFKYADTVDNEKATNPRAVGYSLGVIAASSGFLFESLDPEQDTSSSPTQIDLLDTQIDLSMEASILNALLPTVPVEDASKQLDVRCPTGNCAWDSFDTLGLVRLQPYLDRMFSPESPGHNFTLVEGARAYVLPNGHFLPNPNGCHIENQDRGAWHYCDVNSTISLEQILMTSFGTSNPNVTNTMRDLDTLIWSMSFIEVDYAKLFGQDEVFSDDHSLDSDDDDEFHPLESELYYWPSTPLRAEECALYYCVKTIDSDMLGSEVRETVLLNTDAVRNSSSWKPGTIDSVQELVDAGDLPYGVLPGKLSNNTLDMYPVETKGRTDLYFRFPNDPTRPPYFVTHPAIASLTAWFQHHFRDVALNKRELMGTVADSLGDEAVGFNGMFSASQSKPDHITGLWNGMDEHHGMTPTFEKMAVYMTNAMRNSGVDSVARNTVDFPYNYTEDEALVIGRIGTPTTRYRSEWYWIILHGITLVGAMIFCGITIRTSKREAQVIPAWKSSALAAMSQMPGAVDVMKGAATTEEMEKRAKDSSSRLSLEDTDESKTAAHGLGDARLSDELRDSDPNHSLLTTSGSSALASELSVSTVSDSGEP